VKRKILLLGLVIVVLAGTATLFLRKRPPSYAGKTIYQWLEETDRSRGRIELGPLRIFDWNKETIDRVTEAFRAMGTNAIPILLQELTAEDSLFQRKLKMDGLLNEMHYPYSSLRRMRAAHAFLLLGETARPALPELTRLAGDVRYAHYAQLALVMVDRSQFDAIVNDLKSSDSTRRSFACIYLGELAYWKMVPYHSDILPALVQCAASPQAGERSSAQYAFANFRAGASGARSLLTEAARTNLDPKIQLELTQILKSIPRGVTPDRRPLGPGWPTNADPER